MADSANQLPAHPNNSEFDALNPADFLEPTPETRLAFERLLEGLPFSGVRGRVTEPSYTWQSTESHRVTITVEEHTDDRTRQDYASIVFAIQSGNRDIFVSDNKVGTLTETERATADSEVQTVAANIPEEQGAWVRSAWRELTGGDEDFMPHAVADLLASSPGDVREFADESYGTRKGDEFLEVHRVVANPAHLAYMAARTQATRGVEMIYDGKVYSYGRNANGEEQLRITNEQEHRKIMSDLPTGQARVEALQGRDDFTEGKLKELVSAMQVIIASRPES